MPNQRLAPDALLVQTNLAGAVGDIDDDPDSPDGAWLTHNGGNGDTDCRVSFPTPTGNPTVGAGLQEFRVLIRKNASGGNSTTWSLALWENGSQVSVLATGTVTTTTGEVVAGTWNASALSGADGAQVECRLQQTGGGSSGGGSNRRRIEIGAVEWNAEYTAAGAALEGAAAAEAAATGDLTTGIALAAAAAAEAAATGDLATGIPLAGDAAAEAAAEGTLSNAAAALEGDAAAAATAAGDLTTGIALAGAASGEAAATGDLATGIPLAGDAAAEAAAEGTLTGAPAALEGDATAQAAATGDLTTGIALAGTAAGEAAATGDLATGIPLAGAAAAAATAQGTLTDAPVAFEGGAAATAAAAGTLSRGVAWPPYAQLAFRDYAVRRASGLVRSQIESGPPRQHRLRRRVMIDRPATVWLDSHADYQAFIAWVEAELALGVKWFDWIDPVDGQMKLARIKDGQLLREAPARRQMDHWRVSLTIQTWGNA
jgi:hypothetical protein